MDIVILIGRIVFVSLFLSSAKGHLTKSKMMAGYTKSKGVPFPQFAVLASGVLLLVGALSILFGVWADIGALFLVAFLVPTALLMHPYWKETDPGAKAGDRAHFLKDISLAGASLMLFAFFAFAGTSLGLTLTGSAFSLH